MSFGEKRCICWKVKYDGGSNQGFKVLGYGNFEKKVAVQDVCVRERVCLSLLVVLE